MQLLETQLWTRMPLPVFQPPDMQTFELIGFLDEHVYSGFFIRLAPLCFGALAALCVMDSSCAQKVAR